MWKHPSILVRLRHSLLLGVMLSGLSLRGEPGATPIAPPAQGEVSADQAWQAFREGALFLDARLKEDYTYGHVRGARNLPVWEKDFETLLIEFLAESKPDPKARIIVYCKGCCSTDSMILARRLKDLGFRKVQVYREGYPGWARAERPIAVGGDPGPAKQR